MSVVSRALPHVQIQDVMTTVGQGKVRGVGPTMSLSCDSKWGRRKRSGSVGAEHPADPATSREFAGLSTKIAPNTQSLCVTAPVDEESLITSKIEVKNGMSLRALVDCGASNSFIRRQSLGDRRLNYVER
uniref:Uncharacterized protein n=1 Tax=Peronospora matthiolae TaxID=2874970 RepID=A0AAV1VJT6_9STRA